MEKGPIDQTYPKPEHGQPDMPPPYYPNQPQQQHPVGFVQQPQMASPQVVQMVQIMNLGPQSTRMPCPHCGADVETRVKHNPGRMTHIAALILCLVFWPCVCLPYCIDDCMDAEHECPNCNKFIGSYRR